MCGYSYFSRLIKRAIGILAHSFSLYSNFIHNVLYSRNYQFPEIEKSSKCSSSLHSLAQGSASLSSLTFLQFDDTVRCTNLPTIYLIFLLTFACNYRVNRHHTIAKQSFNLRLKKPKPIMGKNGTSVFAACK